MDWKILNEGIISSSRFFSLKMPLVSEQVKSLGMPWELVLTKWLMCLFADVLPTDTALRVWDCLFYEGSKILIRVALTIVAMVQEQVAAVSNLADLVQIFKDAVGSNCVTNCHEFMAVSFRNNCVHGNHFMMTIILSNIFQRTERITCD